MKRLHYVWMALVMVGLLAGAAPAADKTVVIGYTASDRQT